MGIPASQTVPRQSKSTESQCRTIAWSPIHQQHAKHVSDVLLRHCGYQRGYHLRRNGVGTIHHRHAQRSRQSVYRFYSSCPICQNQFSAHQRNPPD